MRSCQSVTALSLVSLGFGLENCNWFHQDQDQDEAVRVKARCFVRVRYIVVVDEAECIEKSSASFCK